MTPLRAQLLRRGLAVAAPAAVVLTLLLAVPGLQDVLTQIRDMAPGWVVLAIVFEVLSCVSYTVVFGGMFGAVSARTARRVAWVQMGTSSVLPGGGFGGLALAGWLLHQAGVTRRVVLEGLSGAFPHERSERRGAGRDRPPADHRDPVVHARRAGHPSGRDHDRDRRARQPRAGPGGIGALDTGMAASLVLFGAPAAPAIAAVLVYHAILIWTSGLGGLAAYGLLQRSTAAVAATRVPVAPPVPSPTAVRR